MNIVIPVRARSHRLHCARKGRKWLAELDNLSHRQLDDIVVLRGDIPEGHGGGLRMPGSPGAQSLPIIADYQGAPR